MLLVIIEHDRGALAAASEEAMTAARLLADRLGLALHALTIGADADGLVDVLGAFGAVAVHQAHAEVLTDYGPEAWGETIAQFVRSEQPAIVVACGTDRGNEVLAQAAARLDMPMVANVVEVIPTADGTWELVRVRWGGSLLERASLVGATRLVTFVHHGVVAEEAATPAMPTVEPFMPNLDVTLSRTVVRDRVERVAGVVLANARLVVGGGRGVGSPEGFAPLQELASLLGGVVGCSRAVTNAGWRPHTDQVGQTGTRIAADLYIACGISGAIQHWVGAMASRKILAINIDPEANMVAKADYAVIGDLHQVVPAIAAEVRKRKGA